MYTCVHMYLRACVCVCVCLFNPPTDSARLTILTVSAKSSEIRILIETCNPDRSFASCTFACACV